MSRFSPTVLPTAANPFATALNEGFDEFQRARAQKRAQGVQDAQIADQKQRSDDAHVAAETAAYGAGVRPGTAPVETGTDIDVAAVPTFTPPSSADLARQLRGGPLQSSAPTTPAPFSVPAPDLATALRASGTAPATPSVPAAAPTVIPPPPTRGPGAFNAQTGTFGGGPPSPTALALAQSVARTVRLGPVGRYAQLDPTHYIDKKPAQDAAELARTQHQEDVMTPVVVKETLAKQERDRKVAGYVAAGIPEARAQLFVDNPALAENDPTIGKRVTQPKDERMQQRISDLVAGGMTLSAANARARIEFGDSDPLAEHQANRLFDVAHPTADPAIAATRQDALNARNEGRLVQQYTQATKKYSQTADAIQAINENRAGALKGDPIAQQTLLQDFLKLNLPGQIVTASELAHYSSLMGLGDKAGQFIEKLKQGSPLSQTQIKLILGHADNLVAERRKGLNYLRAQYQQRGAGQKVDPEAFPDWFGFLDNDRGDGSAPATGDVNLGAFGSLVPKKP